MSIVHRLAGAGLGVLGWLATSHAALAADPAPTDDDAALEALTGKTAPALESIPDEMVGPPLPPSLAQNAAYPESATRGAAQLKMDVAFVYKIQQGLEKLYLRDYKGAKEYFWGLEKEYPNTALGPVMDTLVWQALMLENFDYRYDKQYVVSSKQARTELEAARSIPGNDAWEEFLLAGISGIDSIHTVRQSNYLAALQLAFEAMDHIQKCREYAPDFTDLLLADGMYNYWRTVVTMNSKMLPDFGDKRTEGLAQMRQVEAGGIFLAAPSTLSLAFAFMDASRYDDAIASCLKNKQRYPKNVVNNLMTGMTYTLQRKYPDALRTFDEVLAADATNQRVHYWKGLALFRSNQFTPAEAEFQTYLKGEFLEDYQRSAALYRLGQCYHRERRWAEADATYTAAIKIDGNDSAKRSLEQIHAARKDGKISY